MSGLSLDEYLRERIFKPLNMTDTYFYLPVEKLDRFAACYTPGDDLRIKLIDAPTPESRFVLSRNPTHISWVREGWSRQSPTTSVSTR